MQTFYCNRSFLDLDNVPNDVCPDRKLRSACSFAQADLGLSLSLLWLAVDVMHLLPDSSGYTLSYVYPIRPGDLYRRILVVVSLSLFFFFFFFFFLFVCLFV